METAAVRLQVRRGADDSCVLLVAKTRKGALNAAFKICGDRGGGAASRGRRRRSLQGGRQGRKHRMGGMVEEGPFLFCFPSVTTVPPLSNAPLTSSISDSAPTSPLSSAALGLGADAETIGNRRAVQVPLPFLSLSPRRQLTLAASLSGGEEEKTVLSAPLREISDPINHQCAHDICLLAVCVCV